MTTAPALWQGADAFLVLGLPYSSDLTDRDVRAAYLLRMRAAHPDNGGDVDAAKAVQAAYETLRSGVRRGELLAALMTDRGPPSSAHEPGTGDVPDAARREELRRRVAASRAAQGPTPVHHRRGCARQDRRPDGGDARTRGGEAAGASAAAGRRRAAPRRRPAEGLGNLDVAGCDAAAPPG
jgi:curved DNA-binding protein CbpA